MAYFSNATEGGTLDAQCSDCPMGAGWNDPKQSRLFKDERPMRCCPTAFVQLLYNYDQVDDKQKKLREAMTLLVNDDGICETRKILVEIREEQCQQSTNET